MEKRKEYPRVIITDEVGKPMAWGGDQLCYCDFSDWRDDYFPVKSYTVNRAKELISKTIKFRNNGGYSVDKYKTMPFDK